VLYARYGEYAKAQEQFNAASAKGDYRPALINLGNLLLAQKQYKQAAAQFQKALKLAPADRASLAGLALAQNGMGEKEDAKASFEQLKAADPGLAARYAFLAGEASGESARAESADQLSLILWQE
jgi:tetratricopeptide (TPR) repeat protein